MPELFPENDPFWPSERAVSFEPRPAWGRWANTRWSCRRRSRCRRHGGRLRCHHRRRGRSPAAGSNRSTAATGRRGRSQAAFGCRRATTRRRGTAAAVVVMPHMATAMAGVGQGATAMQIAPTIKQIETRFDILCSPILKNRSQGGRSTDFHSPARNAHGDLSAGRRSQAGCPWSRSTLTGRLTIAFVAPTNPAGRPDGDRSLAYCAAREWSVCQLSSTEWTRCESFAGEECVREATSRRLQF